MSFPNPETSPISEDDRARLDEILDSPMSVSGQRSPLTAPPHRSDRASIRTMVPGLLRFRLRGKQRSPTAGGGDADEKANAKPTVGDDAHKRWFGRRKQTRSRSIAVLATLMSGFVLHSKLAVRVCHPDEYRSAAAEAQRPFRLFTCGWTEPHFLANLVFDDFQPAQPWTEASSSSSKFDVMVMGEHGPCKGIHRFQGRILFGNPEPGVSMNHRRQTCHYTLSYQPDGGPRHIPTPDISFILGGQSLENQLKIFDHSLKPKSTKKYFMVYATSRCKDFRDEACEALAKVGLEASGSSVHIAGKCPKTFNVTSAVDAPKEMRSAGWFNWRKNMNLFRDYRFCLCMENTYLEGYITEKILNAFFSGCIPIWYGTRKVFDIFNKDAFVYYDINDPLPALNLVRRLEQNETLFDEMQAAPILANGRKTVETYFSFRDEIGNGELKRRIRQMMGLHRDAHNLARV